MDKIRTIKNKEISNSKVLDKLKDRNKKTVVLTQDIIMFKDSDYLSLLETIDNNLVNTLKGSGYISNIKDNPKEVETDDCGDFIGRIWDGNSHEEAKTDGKDFLDLSIYQVYSGAKRNTVIVTNSKDKFIKEIKDIQEIFSDINISNMFIKSKLELITYESFDDKMNNSDSFIEYMSNSDDDFNINNLTPEDKLGLVCDFLAWQDDNVTLYSIGNINNSSEIGYVTEEYYKIGIKEGYLLDLNKEENFEICNKMKGQFSSIIINPNLNKNDK